VGLLDERFIAYFEDSDLSFRARLAGFKAEFVPGAVAYHVGSASIAGRTWWRTRQCYRNHVLVALKNMPASLLIRLGPRILKEHLRGIPRLFSAARAEFGAVRATCILMQTWGSIVAQLPHALTERRRIQGMATLSAKELEDLLG